MSKFGVSEWILAAGLVALLTVPSQVASGAVAEGEPLQFAEAVIGAPPLAGGTADLEMRFIQEDGPDSGNVRVLLTPEARRLTLFEARMAAQQAFLDALTQPGLGEDIRRVVVVVRLTPASHPDLAGSEEKFVFLRKGSKTWSVLAGE